MRECEDQGCGPWNGSHGGQLEVWSHYGQRIAPVYRKWGRHSTADSPSMRGKFGALHVKMFVVGPRFVEDRSEDSQIVVLGSTNWTIAAEANQEFSVVLEMTADGTETMDAVVDDVVAGATRLQTRETQDKKWPRQSGSSSPS